MPSSSYLIWCFLFIFIPITTSQRFTLSTLSPSSSTKPSPRTDHIAISLPSADGPLFILHGGRDQRGSKSDTWTYIVSKNRWTLLKQPSVTSLRPPPLYGAVGGYRFIQGHSHPYLYIALGAIDRNRLNQHIWVMDFKNFSWTIASVSGQIPTPRFGSIGSLERFIKPNGSVKPALIISHGYGLQGPLSDSYKCSFHPTDPFQLSCRQLLNSTSHYGFRNPHPLWKQAGTFTALRDLVMFGGCYASQFTAGLCPSRDVWLMKYHSEQSVNSSSSQSQSNANITSNHTHHQHSYVPETDFVVWERLPAGPAPRIGAAMAQGLASFQDAYSDGLGTIVMYTGSQSTEKLDTKHIFSAKSIDPAEIHLLSTAERAWLTEKVKYLGPPEYKQEALLARHGASMSVIRDTTIENDDEDVPNEYYLIFGGEYDDGKFSGALLKLSFDPFIESQIVQNSFKQYVSSPFVHAILMFISWGVLMILGFLSARYFKDDRGRPRHVMLHALLQTMALIIGWIGCGIALYGRRGSTGNFFHARLGIGLMIANSLQPLIALLGVCAQLYGNSAVRIRRTLLASIFWILHRTMGFVLTIGGCINISLGLLLLVVPVIVWVHWGAYCILLLFIILWMEIIGGRQKGDQIEGKIGLDILGARNRSLRNWMGHRMRRGLSFNSAEIGLDSELVDQEIGMEDDLSYVQISKKHNFNSEKHVEYERAEEICKKEIMAISNDNVLPDSSRDQLIVNEIPRERLESGMSMYTYMDPDSY